MIQATAKMHRIRGIREQMTTSAKLGLMTLAPPFLMLTPCRCHLLRLSRGLHRDKIPLI